MLEGYGSVTQALLGTLFTWGMTAAGAALVVVIRGNQRKLLDIALGFSAGVMTAASYWSLLSPAIDMATESGLYGAEGEYAFAPVAAGFLLGAIFVYGTDIFLDYLGINSTNMMLAMTKTDTSNKPKAEENNLEMERRASHRRNSANIHQALSVVTVETENFNSFGDCINSNHLDNRSSSRRRTVTNTSCEVVQKSKKKKKRDKKVINPPQESNPQPDDNDNKTYEDPSLETDSELELRKSRWKRIMLLVVAITVHNIPEGLAVGVGFAAVGTSATATFQSARNLAIGIGIQNFPEGLAVSLPLQAAGFSVWRSLWYGQLSGMVEPVFGVLGAVAVGIAQPILPYALSFAAGAMIYVVADDIIPEANTGGNGKLATWGCIAGFLVMMCLDVGLG